MRKLETNEWLWLVRAALQEDVGTGDVTTLATVPEKALATACMVAREDLVVAGIELAERTFLELSPGVELNRMVEDGGRAHRGDVLLRVHGPARALLTGERTALNFVQRLSGIATTTARYREALSGTKVEILDTRKTTPGWRVLEKHAVACGGGRNHRTGLYDLILIKDNHLTALAHEKPNAIAAAVRRARTSYPHLEVEVEADTLDQVRQAVEAGADIVLLDNMSPAQLQEAVLLVNGRAKTEASGGVNLTNLKAIAETGVDYVSVGALTHSAKSADIALDFEPDASPLSAGVGTL